MGDPSNTDRVCRATNSPPASYPYSRVISPVSVGEAVAEAIESLRSAARDRALREVSEGDVHAAGDVHDRVLLEAAMKVLDGTPYLVVRGGAL